MENIKLEINKSLGFISKDKLAAYLRFVSS